jgi:hypothetical protein
MPFNYYSILIPTTNFVIELKQGTALKIYSKLLNPDFSFNQV